VLVSTYTSGYRVNPSIAATGSGEFIVVWQDTRPAVDGTHVFGQRLDQDGALVGTEFQIDASGSAAARSPSIVASGDGAFAVVWRSNPGDDERARVLGQRIADDGAAIGTEFQVNTARTLDGDYYLSDARTAPAEGLDGGFVVVWSSGTEENSYPNFGPTSEVYVQTFTAEAQPFNQNDIVSEPGGADEVRAEIVPDVASLGDAGFVVVWAKGYFNGIGGVFDTFARRLHPSGQPTGTEIAVGDAGGTGPHVATRHPAGFTVVWSTAGFTDVIPGYGGALVMRTFDAFSQPLGDALTISSPATGLDPRGDPLRPDAGLRGSAAVSSATGEFVVAWTSGGSYSSEYYGGSSDGDRTGIFARPFARDDSPTGRELQVNAVGQHDQQRPSVAFADSDTLAVVWQANEDEDFEADLIRARIFDLITPACGDGDEDGESDASDALFTLQAAVGSRSCAACLCDVNSSAALTAADALIVLRAAVGTPSPFTCPACSPASVKFSIDSNAPCYGTHIEIPAEAIPDSGVFDQGCIADPALALLGCTSAFASTGNGVTFDARGCVLDPAGLFSCEVSEGEAAAIAEASVTTCGCGCADTCPAAPVLCAATDTEPACAAPLALVSSAPKPVAQSVSFSSVTTVQETVTSSTTCGTCCDYYDDANFTLASDAVITELVLRFPSGRDSSCSEDVSCGFDPAIEGPSYERFLDDGDTIEVCISDSEGFAGPASLGQCNVLTGFIQEGPAEVIRALDAELKPIVPLPAVSVE
jgi:hypothetical protein